MATKVEMANELTVARLRSIAAEYDVSLSGLSTKDEIASAVAEGLTAAELEAAVADEEPDGQAGDGSVDVSPEALVERGEDAASLELSGPAQIPGEVIKVKQNPEVPSQAQVDAASGDTAGPPITHVTIVPADGDEREHELRPDDAALISQRTVSQQETHPAFTEPGNWSNDSIAAPVTETQREADQQAYRERVKA
jgi:hypothetical protein